VEKIKYKSGSTYKGPIVNGKPNGRGLYERINGDRIIGEFKDGMLHGKVKETKTDGQIFDG